MIFLIFIIDQAVAIFNCRKLLLLELNDLGCVALIHLNLSLAQGLILGDKTLILTLQESHILSQLLHLTCRLSLNVLCDFLILSLTCTFQSLNLVLQLLVLILHLYHLLSISLIRAGATNFPKPCKLCSHL